MTHAPPPYVLPSSLLVQADLDEAVPAHHREVGGPGGLAAGCFFACLFVPAVVGGVDGGAGSSTYRLVFGCWQEKGALKMYIVFWPFLIRLRAAFGARL